MDLHWGHETVYEFKRKSKSVWDCVCVCVLKSERVRMCVYVRVSLCVCVCVWERVCVWTRSSHIQAQIYPAFLRANDVQSSLSLSLPLNTHLHTHTLSLSLSLSLTDRMGRRHRVWSNHGGQTKLVVPSLKMRYM